MSESDNWGFTVWNAISDRYRASRDLVTKLSSLKGTLNFPSLLKIFVMLEDAPADFMTKILSQHAEICSRGRQLRALLPSYQEQQWATVIENCFLPAVLQSLIAAYAITTQEDMWENGLRVQAPRVKRDRTKKRRRRWRGCLSPPSVHWPASAMIICSMLLTLKFYNLNDSFWQIFSSF